MNIASFDSLDPNLIAKIGSFLDPDSAFAFSLTSKATRKDCNYLLNDLQTEYERVFGKLNQTSSVDKIFARLLSYAEKRPDPKVNHNIYKVPSNRLERWKWRAGVENALDKEVQRNYNKAISLLENTQATTIIHLTSKINGFWYIDRQMEDYKKFKKEIQTTSRLVDKIFFTCLRFLFKLYYNNSNSLRYHEKTVTDRSREIFVKIGEFNLHEQGYKEQDSKEQGYDVIAFHEFFNSNTRIGGRTCIGILKKREPFSTKLFDHSGPNLSFSINIERERQIKEDSIKTRAQRRYLQIGKTLEYRNQTGNLQGSDRLLDQKLTQIMIEVLRQNRKIDSLLVDSSHDDFPVLTAGGFLTRNRSAKQMNDELQEFRNIEGNNLFPPYEDYTSISTAFPTKNLDKRNVSYSRGNLRSWEDIIEEQPILNPNTAVLPECWRYDRRF